MTSLPLYPLRQQTEQASYLPLFKIFANTNICWVATTSPMWNYVKGAVNIHYIFKQLTTGYPIMLVGSNLNIFSKICLLMYIPVEWSMHCWSGHLTKMSIQWMNHLTEAARTLTAAATVLHTSWPLTQVPGTTKYIGSLHGYRIRNKDTTHKKQIK